jgi:hypothetical protein
MEGFQNITGPLDPDPKLMASKARSRWALHCPDQLMTKVVDTWRKRAGRDVVNVSNGLL